MKLFRGDKMIALRQVLLGVMAVIATTYAFAHVSLVSTMPAADSIVVKQPEKLTLNFADAVMLMNIKLVDAQKKEIPLNFKVNHAFKKSFDITVPQLVNGKYTVIWMTMGKDGHHMTGEYTFIIKKLK